MSAFCSTCRHRASFWQNNHEKWFISPYRWIWVVLARSGTARAPMHYLSLLPVLPRLPHALHVFSTDQFDPICDPITTHSMGFGHFQPWYIHLDLEGFQAHSRSRPVGFQTGSS
jgi:hypothetical protein